jgi:hypothetical protein
MDDQDNEFPRGLGDPDFFGYPGEPDIIVILDTEIEEVPF